MAINIGTNSTPFTHSIGNFITNFNGGTRPNRFRITFSKKPSVPGSFTQTGLDGILALSSSLPESLIGTIPIPFRGRVYKFPGDRDYLPWNITLIDDTGFSGSIYDFWHGWSSLFNGHYDNISSSRDYEDIYATIVVEHLDHVSSATLKKFELNNCWPMQIGPLELNSANANQLSTFTCQIAYSHYSLITSPAP